MKVATSLSLCATAANQQSDAGHQEPQSDRSAGGARRRDFAARTGIDEVPLCPLPSDGFGGKLGIGDRVGTPRAEGGRGAGLLRYLEDERSLAGLARAKEMLSEQSAPQNADRGSADPVP